MRTDVPLLPCKSLWVIHLNYASVHWRSVMVHFYFFFRVANMLEFIELLNLDVHLNYILNHSCTSLFLGGTPILLSLIKFIVYKKIMFLSPKVSDQFQLHP